jgi:hypothetical protein
MLSEHQKEKIVELLEELHPHCYEELRDDEIFKDMAMTALIDICGNEDEAEMLLEDFFDGY